jgi:ketosteroid isomerase-like protein
LLSKIIRMGSEFLTLYDPIKTIDLTRHPTTVTVAESSTMKKPLLLATLITTATLLLTSCGRGSPREFADKFIAAENKAWNAGELEDLKALESVDVKYHLPGAELVGWKAHEDYILQSRPTISSLKQNWKYLSGEGNHFVLSYDSNATVTGKDGKPATSVSSFLCVFRIDNGKVAEVWMNGSTTPLEN